MDMRVNIAGVEWKNPVTVASGTFGSGEEFSEFVDLNKLGAVTTKGVANVPEATVTGFFHSTPAIFTFISIINPPP